MQQNVSHVPQRKNLRKNWCCWHSKCDICVVRVQCFSQILRLFNVQVLQAVLRQWNQYCKEKNSAATADLLPEKALPPPLGNVRNLPQGLWGKSKKILKVSFFILSLHYKRTTSALNKQRLSLWGWLEHFSIISQFTLGFLESTFGNREFLYPLRTSQKKLQAMSNL